MYHSVAAGVAVSPFAGQTPNNSPVPTPSDTLMQRAGVAAELLKQQAEAIEARLRDMRARLVGATPEPGTDAGRQASQFSGAVGTLDMRLTETAAAQNRAMMLLTELEKIV